MFTITERTADSRRKGIAAILVTLWAITLAYAAFAVTTGRVSTYSSQVHRLRLAGTPLVEFNTYITFSAVGSFSANNPTKVVAKVLDANVSDFTQYFCCIAFTNAFDVSPKYTTGGRLVNALLNFTNGGNGTYIAKGEVVWNVEGDSWNVILRPTPPTLNTGDTNLGPPSIHISSVTDTNSWRTNEIATKLSVILVGFSILMLQPVLEAFAIPQRLRK